MSGIFQSNAKFSNLSIVSLSSFSGNHFRSFLCLELVQDNWFELGHDLFPNDCFSHPGKVDYSDRQSWPLFITKSQNSQVIKIWNEDIFSDPNVGPQLEFDKLELKDFRHF